MLNKKVFVDTVIESIAQGLERPTARGQINNKLITLLHENRYLLAGRRGCSPCFDDAWAITIAHFSQNLWAVETKGTQSAYCETPDVISRLKCYLGHRIDDAEMELRGYQQPSDNAGNQQWKMKPLPLDATNLEGTSSLGDIVAAPSDKYRWLRELIESDETGQLQNTVMKKYPHVNCQNAQLLFLDGYSWREIAVMLGVPEQALYTFLSRKCWPLMKKLCE